MGKIKVVHYINQFFAQIGGEEKADFPAQLRKGEVVGPGLALMQAFGDEAEIIATIVCGDSYFNENIESATKQILEWVKEEAPDVFIAGPAFNAGRYGVACGTVADAVQSELNMFRCGGGHNLRLVRDRTCPPHKRPNTFVKGLGFADVFESL